VTGKKRTARERGKNEFRKRSLPITARAKEILTAVDVEIEV